MKILVVSDIESKYIWDHFDPELFRDVKMIISCGDLSARYLSFLVTMIPCPLFYVPGNHDKKYEREPPEGCVNIDGRVIEYKGVRLMGLGGCKSPHPCLDEYSEEQNQIKNTAGMKLSANKLEAVKVSAPKDRWLNLFLGFPLYHGRFDELTEKDFSQFPWSAGLENFKGSYLLYGTGNYELESAAGVTARRDIMDKELEYLNKIITLCRERSIPLMLLKTPALERRDAQPIYNTVSDIASINGLDFVNMNLMDDETGVTAADWSLDRHMNGSGARKVAHWLGAFLQSEYGIADHRGDARYASWDINAHTVNDDYLAAITDNADYFAELRRGGRAALVIKQSPWTENDAYSALAAELESVGFTGLKSAKDNDAFLVSDTASGADAPASVSGDAVTFTLDGEELTVSFEYQDAVLGGKRLSWFGSSEMTLIVYDTTTHELVDVVTFSSLNGYKLRRAESTD